MMTSLDASSVFSLLVCVVTVMSPHCSLVPGVSGNDETKSKWSRPGVRSEGSVQDIWQRQGRIHWSEGAENGGHHAGLYVDLGGGGRVHEGGWRGES